MVSSILKGALAGALLAVFVEVGVHALVALIVEVMN